MTLKEAAKLYPVRGIDKECISDEQEESFRLCLDFLQDVSKIKSQNIKHTSYGLKHVVENPSARFNVPASADCYSRYVYEGTFILAALVSGFSMRQRGHELKVTFNISEISLRKRANEVARKRQAEAITRTPSIKAAARI